MGFAYLIRGRNEENKSVLAGVTVPHALRALPRHALRALVFPFSLPFDACHAGYFETEAQGNSEMAYSKFNPAAL